MEEFTKFIDLPRVSGEQLELTLAIDPDDPDWDLFQTRGWRLEQPSRVSTPGRYRGYVAGSLGEFSCAKGGYVGTRSGWFSDRSACYLAAGRPVVLQSTGVRRCDACRGGVFRGHHIHRTPEIAPISLELAEPLGVPLREHGQVTFVGGFYGQWQWGVTDLEHISPEFLIWIIRQRGRRRLDGARLPPRLHGRRLHLGLSDTSAR